MRLAIIFAAHNYNKNNSVDEGGYRPGQILELDVKTDIYIQEYVCVFIRESYRREEKIGEI